MTIPKLSEEDVRSRVGTQSFERGYRYFHDGAIFDARRQGMVLKAYCEGSQPQPYRVRVTFDPGGIQEAHCSCPVGGSGYCKHVAALLLTWLYCSGDFREVEELDTTLERRSKGELIALIKQMLLRQPELEVLFETPLPTSGKRRTPVDPETYRRQAATAFRHVGYEWGAEEGVADDLEATIEIGDGFVDQEDYASAAAVYQAVAQEVLSHYEGFEDEGGELGEVVNDCVEGLGQCLASVKDDPVTREGILHALFNIYHFDVDFGGVGLGDDVPNLILEHATPGERHTVADWVRAALPPKEKDSWSDNWHRQEYGGFLLELEKEELDDEAYLSICRETGRLKDLVDRLLSLRRREEAAAEAEKASDYDLLQLADIFVTHGHGETAEHLVAERAKTTKDWRILDWLKVRYKERGDFSAALALAQKLFQMHSSLSGYQEVRNLAQQLGVWEELRTQLLTDLTTHNQYDLLTRIYLDEGEIDRALEAVKHTRSSRFPPAFWGADLQVEVARAAEETRPHAAIELYHHLVEGLINARGRDNYQRACVHLARMRDLYRRTDRDEEWAHYIADLRERNHNLRALKEELANAGL